MKKQSKKKLALVLALSLILANHYVEYGKKVKASETEQMMMETESFKGEEILETETEEESETESESESESETEAISEPVPESETEPTSEPVPESETEQLSEKVSESETEQSSETMAESETEQLSEKVSESETEQPSETMTERESETEIGSETEQLSEEMTESESEQFSEEITESESETELQIKIIRIFNINANIPEGGRIYDGTSQIELNYETEGLEPDSGLEVQYQARLSGSDVGEWPVEYQFQLAGKGAEEYELQVELKELTVTVLPKPLAVIIPDGWKAYGKDAEMKNIHLQGKVQVTGFLKDENGEEQIPEGFELPEIALDSSAVGQWSDIYEAGVQKVYKNVLTMKRTKEGMLTGNPTGNYIFSENEEKGEYKKGSLVIAPSEVIQGTDYEVKGEDGACFQAADGTFWVRQGSGFQILPRKDRGYTEGWNSGPVSQGGTLNFTLKKRNKNGEITAVSLEQQAGFQVDGDVPQAEIEISGAREENGIRYGNGNVYVQIRIPEDGGSGIKSARYFMAVSGKALPAQVPENREWWQDCTNGMQLQLAQQGTYVVYVETEDQTGNKAYTKSEEIRIDTEKPAIKIGGVRDNSANGGEVCLTVDCQDENYRSGSLKVEISGTNGTFVPVQNENQETEQGAWMTFADFEHVKTADDIYTVCASAEDLAGNQTEASITFSVNRFGSVYDLDPGTKQELKQYYHRQPFAITFLETNLDYVGSVQILCKREGLVTELVENRDYFATCSETENGWKQYSYRIPAKTFQKEGSYEVLLLSSDRAENSSDSQVQEKEVRFTIDRSAPDCLITGLEAGKIYQTDVLWACLEPRDNICLKEMRVYLDGKRAAEYSGEELQKMGGLIKWKAEAKEQWQRLQIQVTDAAGNQMWTEEIPFYVTGKETLENILPYEKVEKSARELEESRLSLEMLKKKTGEYGMGNVVTQEKTDEIATAVYVSRGNSNGKKAVIGTAVRGILKQIFVTKTVFLLVGILGLVFLLLSVSIRHFRRKR